MVALRADYLPPHGPGPVHGASFAASLDGGNHDEGRCGLLQRAERKCGCFQRQSDCPLRALQLGHGFGLEELLALARCPSSPALGLLAAGAVGRDAGTCVHLAVELGEEDEGDPRAQVRRAG